LLCCDPILRATIAVKALAPEEVSPSGQPCVASHVNSMSADYFEERVGPT